MGLAMLSRSARGGSDEDFIGSVVLHRGRNQRTGGAFSPPPTPPRRHSRRGGRAQRRASASPPWRLHSDEHGDYNGDELAVMFPPWTVLLLSFPWPAAACAAHLTPSAVFTTPWPWPRLLFLQVTTTSRWGTRFTLAPRQTVALQPLRYPPST